MAQLCKTFRSVKPHTNLTHNPKSPKLSPPPLQQSASSPSSLQQSKSSPPSPSRTSKASSRSGPKSWSVYLILSTTVPIKTYVGVTTDFSRRLRQHNGELKGGAKASRVGRPWICACIIQGFNDRNEACAFESKWKSSSKKLPRKRNQRTADRVDNGLLLLQHREAALSRVRCSFDCNHLDIGWQVKPS